MGLKNATASMRSAKHKCKEVREALHKRRVFIYPTDQNFRGQTPYWESSFAGPCNLVGLGGQWKLHGYWRYWSDPLSGQAELRDSSVGVTVEGHGQENLPPSVCVARYDMELHGGKRGRHINVFQPVVSDEVHWICMDKSTQFEDWSLELLLDFLIDTLPIELRKAGWPVV